MHWDSALRSALFAPSCQITCRTTMAYVAQDSGHEQGKPVLSHCGVCFFYDTSLSLVWKLWGKSTAVIHRVWNDIVHGQITQSCEQEMCCGCLRWGFLDYCLLIFHPDVRLKTSHVHCLTMVLQASMETQKLAGCCPSLTSGEEVAHFCHWRCGLLILLACLAMWTK